MKWFFSTMTVVSLLGLCTPVHAQPFFEPEAVEKIDIDELTQSVIERSKKLRDELKASKDNLENGLRSLEEVEQHFETMFKIVNDVLKHLGMEEELVVSLRRYHDYANNHARLLKQSSIAKVQKLASEWEKRAKRAEELLEDVSAKRLEGLEELRLIEDDKEVAIEFVILKIFDDAMDAAQESLNKVGGIITDMKSISAQLAQVEPPEPE